MKKAIVFILIGLCLFNCTDRQEDDEILGSTEDQIVKTNFKLLSNGNEIVLTSLKTSSYGVFFTRLYDHFLLLDSLLKDNTFFDYLINDGLFSDTNQIPFTNILRAFNEYAEEIIFSNALLNSIDSDTSLYVENYQYFPVIYISNFSTLKDDYSPICGFGSDLENIDDSISGDIIYGRYYDQNLSLYEIEINEENGTNSEIPILIITPEVSDIVYLNSENQNNNFDPKLFDESQLKAMDIAYPYFDEYKIDNLYDKSNRAEYSEQHWYYYSDGTDAEDATHDLIKKIHKRDIGNTIFYDDHEIARWVPSGKTLAGYWITTFEYDWYALRKPVIINGPVGARSCNCKMTFVNEFYQKSFFWIPTPGGNSITIVTKGYCKIVTN